MAALDDILNAVDFNRIIGPDGRVIEAENKFLCQNQKTQDVAWIPKEFFDMEDEIIEEQDSVQINQESEDSGIEVPVWSSRHPTRSDLDATARLLEILKEPTMKQKLNDKQTKKQDLYLKIGNTMIANGFYLGEKIWQRIKSKCGSLERSYRDHKKHMNTTGTQKKDPPQFYEQMHAAFGDKHTNAPAALSDSLSDNIQTTRPAGQLSTQKVTHSSADLPSQLQPTPNDLQTDNDENENSFTSDNFDIASPSVPSVEILPIIPKTHPSTKPKSHQAQILEEIRKLGENESKHHSELLTRQDDRMEKLEKMTEKHHRERQENICKLIEAIRGSKAGPSKKRKKHHTDSSDSDS